MKSSRFILLISFALITGLATTALSIGAIILKQENSENPSINFIIDTLFNKSMKWNLNFPDVSVSACDFSDLFDGKISDFKDCSTGSVLQVSYDNAYKGFKLERSFDGIVNCRLMSIYFSKRFKIFSSDGIKLLHDSNKNITLCFVSSFKYSNMHSLRAIYFLDKNLMPLFAIKRRTFNKNLQAIDSLVCEKYLYNKEGNDFYGKRIIFRNLEIEDSWKTLSYDDLLDAKKKYSENDYLEKENIYLPNGYYFRKNVPIWSDVSTAYPLNAIK